MKTELKTVIKVDGLSKEYAIGRLRTRENFREMLGRRTGNVWKRFSGCANDRAKNFLAVKNVSFEVKEGEIVGIVGRNGAGKSTLLKILSRVTLPSTGEARMWGRASSLLEVGTGFHPELTGRENIYLNGAILGMKRSEIGSKFDEIVAFSEIEKFIDTPVKHYSSGMYVRLAFSVAAHLNSEILIVDEVLAVGDYGFQKKCLGKMGDVAQSGRTVLLVSHNMPALLRLSNRALWLDNGELRMEGESRKVIESYILSNLDARASVKIWPKKDFVNADFCPVSLKVTDVQGQTVGAVKPSETFEVEFEYELRKSVQPGFRAGIYLSTAQGELIFTSWDSDNNRERWNNSREAGHYVSRCRVPANLLNEGDFLLGINAGVFNVKSFITDEYCLLLRVVPTDEAVGGHWVEKRAGFIRPKLEWELKKI